MKNFIIWMFSIIMSFVAGMIFIYAEQMTDDGMWELTKTLRDFNRRNR